MKRIFWRRKKRSDNGGEPSPPPEVSGVEVYVVADEERSSREKVPDSKAAEAIPFLDEFEEGKQAEKEAETVFEPSSLGKHLIGQEEGVGAHGDSVREDVNEGMPSFPKGEVIPQGDERPRNSRKEPAFEQEDRAKQLTTPSGNEGAERKTSPEEEFEQPEGEKPEAPGGAAPEGGPAGYYYPFPYPPYSQPPYAHPYYQGMFSPPPGGKRGKSRRRAGEKPNFPAWGVPWWLPPVMPPVIYPTYPPQVEPAQGPSAFFAIPEEHISPEGFQKLARGEGESRRVDLKWLFGVTAALILFVALVVSSLFIVTVPKNAKRITAGILRDASLVREAIDENYYELRSKAKRKPQTSFLIPDVGIDIFLKGRDIFFFDAEDLTEKVITLMSKSLYSEGYSADIPLKTPRGAGEERAKAICTTMMSSLNNDFHGRTLIPLVVIACVAIAMTALSLAFSVGWGRVITAALIFLCASFPVSFLARFFSEFVLTGGGGTYKDAASGMLRTAISSSVYVFDAVLGAGALLLFIGVIGAVVSRKRMERVPPFLELKTGAELTEQVFPGAPLQDVESENLPGLEGFEEEKPGEDTPGL